jgi:two-component system response regulator PilR (NtrC family)
MAPVTTAPDELPFTPPASGEFEPKTLPILQPSVRNLEGYLEQIERTAILRALEETRYNKTAAAEKLGISFRALRYRLKKLGLY